VREPGAYYIVNIGHQKLLNANGEVVTLWINHDIEHTIAINTSWLAGKIQWKFHSAGSDTTVHQATKRQLTFDNAPDALKKARVYLESRLAAKKKVDEKEKTARLKAEEEAERNKTETNVAAHMGEQKQPEEKAQRHRAGFSNPTFQATPLVERVRHAGRDHQVCTAATFNIAYGCQNLQLGGTENVTVRRMRKENAPKFGQYAAEFMARCEIDFLGVQEMMEDNGKRFRDFMNSERLNRGGAPNEYDVFQPHGVYQNNHMAAIFYRAETLGRVEHLAELRADRDGVRSVAAIYIPKFQMVFLSIWLNHKDKDKVAVLESIDGALQEAIGCRPVSRVMAAMDSNDYSGNRLAWKSFTLLGHSLVNSGECCRTCAEDSGFKGCGDLIFDSAKPDPFWGFGVPVLPWGWTKTTQLMSDHLPVMAEKSVKIVSY
jgi:hypothetical protein